MARMRDVHDVAARQLCTGCGVCAYLAPDQIRMIDVPEHGRRPLPIAAVTGGAAAALASCPGAALAHPRRGPGPGEIAEVRALWGPIRAMWEGYAADPDIRFAGSSGGAITALAAFCIERLGMSGALHIGARADVPYLNETRFSTTRDGLMAATGSRYAPASPCDRLDLIEGAESPAVFVGKPCDVAAARMAAQTRPALADRLGLTIAFFCAGTPSTRGTLEMLARLDVEPTDATSVRYRGQGWPGRARVTAAGDPPERDRSLSYDQSWGEILQRHRQWRCYLCVDHTGEFADISVGDAWHRPIAGDPGRSLVLARTERGVRIVEQAIRAGVLVLEPLAPRQLAASQPNLVQTRGAVWGRILTLRAAGQAAPRYRNLPAAGAWWRELSLKDKLRSTLGTLRRIVRRRLWRPVALTGYEAPSLQPATPRGDASGTDRREAG
jgi:coenzyme F420 hydrogenase subunit beta